MKNQKSKIFNLTRSTFSSAKPIKNYSWLLLVAIAVSCSQPGNKIDLSGKWQVALDSLDTGINEKWFEVTFNDEITLPGTLLDGGYGNPCTLKPAMEREIFLNLKRRYDYVGVAWYTRQVKIPANWNDKQVFLYLERVIWISQVWVNGRKVELVNESLSTPHQFDLTQFLTPGKNQIAIRIDNRKQHDISHRDMAHAYTNETQTMWNGIIGEIALKAVEKTSIRNMTLTPDVDASKVRVQLDIEGDVENRTGKIVFKVRERNGKRLPVKEAEWTGGEISFEYPIKNPKLWDEFNPHLYDAEAELRIGKTTHRKQATFGMRKLSNQRALLHINDRMMFLRGTLECCIFPLKGYPPMDREGWQKLYGAARDYGLNHIRFHSWCPPKAAFEVADEMGIYLQVELPLWVLTVGNDPKTVDFLFDEADKIMKAYSNHPSFCFWSLGNELQGCFRTMDSLMMSLKNRNNRHLYTTTSFTFQREHGRWPETNDDFWITQWTKKGWVRGQGVFDTQPAGFLHDYRAAIDSIPVPIVTHEIGQYSVFPNLKEIDKYTGNLIPLNFMAVKNDLEKKGRLSEADDYLMSTGKLAAILYKEEIERALKTPGISGFQLLDLHDFPGQGTALVGLLDAFWDSKGIIASEEFRSFCAPVVPLVRFAKATYTNDEIFEVSAEVANFGDRELVNIAPEWKLIDSQGQIVAQGTLPKQNIAIGNTLQLGEFSAPLSSIRDAEKLTLSLSIKNTKHCNSWEIWVYPAKLETVTNDVVYTRDFDEARQALQQGKKVLLNPDKEKLNGLEGKFVQVFWSPVHFPNQPGTMGILCDPTHPALKDFPTEMHANWQWWDICKSGKTLVLDSLCTSMQPIVRVVDNFFKNRNLGLIFETKVGNGKLLVCSPDLHNELENRQVARQLRHSLTQYMASDAFDPIQSFSFEQVETAFHQVISVNER